MAALDFPSVGLTVGQKYPQPAIPGVPVYTWDGEKWTTIGGTIGSTGGADDPPPMDGAATPGVSTQWAREDHAHPSDTSRQSTAFTPVGNIAATTVSGAIAELDTEKVAKAGDTISGDLTISSGGPSLFLNGTDNAALPEVTFQHVNINRWSNYVSTGPAADYNIARYDDAGSLIGNALTASRSTGLMTIAGDPTVSLGIATKQYVDAKAASTRYSIAGVNSFDVTVPSDAKSVRITGFINPSGTNLNPVMYVSVASGVFRTTSGEYVCNGFYHDVASTPTNVVNFNSSLHSGHILAGGHSNIAIALQFDGVLLLKRPNTTILFGANFTGMASAGGVQHSYTHTYLTNAAAGSALSILAFRVASVGDAFGDESYINVQWM